MAAERPAASSYGRCPECGRTIRLRDDGTLRQHSPTWKNPPPGAPMCTGGRKPRAVS